MEEVRMVAEVHHHCLWSAVTPRESRKVMVTSGDRFFLESTTMSTVLSSKLFRLHQVIRHQDIPFGDESMLSMNFRLMTGGAAVVYRQESRGEKTLCRDSAS